MILRSLYAIQVNDYLQSDKRDVSKLWVDEQKKFVINLKQILIEFKIFAIYQ